MIHYHRSGRLLLSQKVYIYVYILCNTSRRAASCIGTKSPGQLNIAAEKMRRYCLPFPITQNSQLCALNLVLITDHLDQFFSHKNLTVMRPKFWQCSVMLACLLGLHRVYGAQSIFFIILCCYCRSVSAVCTISLCRRSSQQVHYLIMDPKRSPTPPSTPQPTLPPPT